MASVAYSLHQVSSAPLWEERESPDTQICNSPAADFREYRAASQDQAEKGVRNPRAHQTARESGARVEGRLEERRRIARELHDTLLQSFQASLVRMQVARNILVRRPEQAAQDLDRAINVAAAAIAEAREAIQELRGQTREGADMEKSLMLALQELARAQESTEPPVRFRVMVEGQRRPLQSFIQDEVYQIGRELLRNAFRHAQASEVEAEIRYQKRFLCLHVRDNGTGIDEEVLESGGRNGHWGLKGIRERAERICATLEFWTKKGAGTEVRLTVPASEAYAEGKGAAGLNLESGSSHE